jgi:methylenetetrahydrofolate dehydrogenase (NADP+)/methenyltetrahydrofolate cyclohydrolase
MAARIIDGRALAESIRQRVTADVAELKGRGRAVSMAAVLIGDDAAALAFAAAQARAAAEVGIAHRLIRLPASATPAQAIGTIDSLNRDATVAGLLLFQPTPPGLDSAELQQRIDPGKDAEGVSPANLGRLFLGRDALPPCTASAAFECIRSTGIDLKGCRAVVVGRSNIVGKPLAAMLLAAHATVTQCHSRTPDLAAETRRADVLAVAIGRPELVGAEHVRPGAIVIDVGTNRVRGPDGRPRTAGDVQFDSVAEVAGWITPVPGGVGPLTVAMLMANVAKAAREERV